MFETLLAFWDPPAEDETRYREARSRMVSAQIAARGIRDPEVLRAMSEVPRHLFVPAAQLRSAYDDMALSIGEGQTISQPYMVALMTAALAVKPGQRVLEVGTGSGYQCAVLVEMGAEVFTIERVAVLASQVRERLERLGFARCVRFRVGDGTVGWAEEAPFDGIVVTAGAPSVPPSLCEQLTIGGRLVIPVGRQGFQDLLVITRKESGPHDERRLCGCTFVPLIGQEGWPDD